MAKLLAPPGVRVFILKYRILPLPDSFDGFKTALASTFQRGEGAEERDRQAPYAIAVAQVAFGSSATTRANGRRSQAGGDRRRDDCPGRPAGQRARRAA